MTANRPTEVWEAALGRHVVLIEARTWFEARDVARLMLGGEPATLHAAGTEWSEMDAMPLFFWEFFGVAIG